MLYSIKYVIFYIIVINVYDVNEYCCLNVYVIYNGVDNIFKFLKMKC